MADKKAYITVSIQIRNGEYNFNTTTDVTCDVDITVPEALLVSGMSLPINVSDDMFYSARTKYILKLAEVEEAEKESE